MLRNQSFCLVLRFGTHLDDAVSKLINLCKTQIDFNFYTTHKKKKEIKKL